MLYYSDATPLKHAPIAVQLLQNPATHSEWCSIFWRNKSLNRDARISFFFSFLSIHLVESFIGRANEQTIREMQKKEGLSKNSNVSSPHTWLCLYIKRGIARKGLLRNNGVKLSQCIFIPGLSAASLEKLSSTRSLIIPVFV